jgi:hypothetical protein
MRFALFDPDDFRTEDLPAFLRPLHRAYLWASCRVTGHAGHALNGLLVWLPFSWLLPLAWFWPLPVVFYTLREVPGLFWDDGEALDHVGDVVWVYAIGIALWFPPWCLVAWMVLTGVVQVAYWSRPAPGWMPRESLLWGRR